jgi:hypothetical protein
MGVFSIMGGDFMNITGVGASSTSYAQQLQSSTHSSKTATLHHDHDGDIDTGGSDTNDGKGRHINVKA